MKKFSGLGLYNFVLGLFGMGLTLRDIHGSVRYCFQDSPDEECAQACSVAGTYYQLFSGSLR